eukprot:9396305-Lingulodinium_polyedra.AAC.1
MPKGVAKDFVNLYELFLISGASVGDAKAKVCELFSPPRVTAEATRLPKLGVIAGATFDLREDRYGKKWNFLREDDRRRARQQINAEKPYFVVGSPPCTYFSVLAQWNRFRMGPEVYRRKL